MWFMEIVLHIYLTTVEHPDSLSRGAQHNAKLYD